jgi:hypothetical protein
VLELLIKTQVGHDILYHRQLLDAISFYLTPSIYSGVYRYHAATVLLIGGFTFSLFLLIKLFVVLGPYAKNLLVFYNLFFSYFSHGI